MSIKKNIPLILGVGIPVLMVVFISFSIYIPGVFFHPKTNFLYQTGDSYQANFVVERGRLVKREISLNNQYARLNEPKLYVYEVLENKSIEITEQKAQDLALDSNLISEDGYEIVSGTSSGGFFPFFFYSSNDYYSLYIKGHNISRKLNINVDRNFSNTFRFLGWIKK